MLGLQVRLTSGPKRHALEMMRSKIEQQNERVVSARQRHAVAKQAFMLLDEELQREEEAKERLCSELNMLIQQSAELQVRRGSATGWQVGRGSATGRQVGRGSATGWQVGRGSATGRQVGRGSATGAQVAAGLGSASNIRAAGACGLLGLVVTGPATGLQVDTG